MSKSDANKSRCFDVSDAEASSSIRRSNIACACNFHYQSAGFFCLNPSTSSWNLEQQSRGMAGKPLLQGRPPTCSARSRRPRLRSARSASPWPGAGSGRRLVAPRTLNLTAAGAAASRAGVQAMAVARTCIASLLRCSESQILVRRVDLWWSPLSLTAVYWSGICRITCGFGACNKVFPAVWQ